MREIQIPFVVICELTKTSHPFNQQNILKIREFVKKSICPVYLSSYQDEIQKNKIPIIMHLPMQCGLEVPSAYTIGDDALWDLIWYVALNG